VIAGSHIGVTFDPLHQLEAPGTSDAFVAQLGPGGAVIWVRPLGASESAAYRSIQAAAGLIAAGGWFTGSVIVGGAVHQAGNRGQIAVELGPTGAVVDSRAPTSPCPDTPDGIALAYAAPARLFLGATIDCSDTGIGWYLALDEGYQRRFGAEGDGLSDVAAALDGLSVAAATGGARRIDAAGQPVWTFTAHPVDVVAIGAGRVLLAGARSWSIVAP
jgi:hypothetical protein